MRTLNDDLLKFVPDLKKVPKADVLQLGPSKEPIGNLGKYQDLAFDQIAWPMLNQDSVTLSKFPHTFVQVSEFDAMRDEGFLFYDRLRSLKVKTTLSFVPKSGHCDAIVRLLTGRAQTQQSQQSISDYISFIKQF